MNILSLKNVINQSVERLMALGFSFSFQEEHNGLYSVQIDHPNYVGSICFWKDHSYEFHLINKDSGKDVALITKHIGTEAELQVQILTWFESSITD